MMQRLLYTSVTYDNVLAFGIENIVLKYQILHSACSYGMTGYPCKMVTGNLDAPVNLWCKFFGNTTNTNSQKSAVAYNVKVIKNDIGLFLFV